MLDNSDFWGQQEKFVQSQFLNKLSLNSGLAEMAKKYSVLWKISVTVKHLIKKAFLALLNFTKSKASFWKPSRKCTRVFVVCADYPT